MNAVKTYVSRASDEIRRDGLNLLYNYLILEYTPIHLFLHDKSNLIWALPFLLSITPEIALNGYHITKLFIIQPDIPDDIREILLFHRQQLIPIISSLSTSQGMYI